MNAQNSYHQDPKQLVDAINKLIRSYQQTRSPIMALSIAQHLQVLCSHPDCENQNIDRCLYLRMRPIWQLLSHDPQTATIAA